MKRLFEIVLLTAVYAVAGRLALFLVVAPGYVCTIFPSAGIALGTLLIFGTRLWPGVWLGSFTLNLWLNFNLNTAPPLLPAIGTALAISSGAALQALLACWLIKRFVGFPSLLAREREVVPFLVLGAASCALNATVGATTLWVVGYISPSAYVFNWWTWWVGDSLGVILFTPLLVIWLLKPRAEWAARRWPITLPLVLSFIVTTIFYFYSSRSQQESIQNDFERRTHGLAAAIDQSFRRYFDLIHSGKGLLVTFPRLGPTEFHSFSKNLLATLPGFHSVTWTPVGGRPGEEGDPLRRSALQQALQSGDAVVTRRMELMQDGKGQTGLLVLEPIFFPEPLHDQRHLVGYVSAVLRVGDVVEAAIDRQRAEGIDFELREEGVADTEQPLYCYRTSPGMCFHMRQPENTWERVTLSLGDRRVVLDFTPTKAFVEAQKRWGAWALMASGLFFSGLLGAFLLVVTGRPVIIEKTVNEELDKRLRELRTSEKYVKILQVVAAAANRASSFPEILQICLDEVCAVTQWPVGHVYLVAEGNKDLLLPSEIWHLSDQRRFEKFRHLTAQTPLRGGMPLPGLILVDGKAAFIPDVAQNRKFLRARCAAEVGLKSGIGFPIHANGKVAGVLEFYAPEIAEPEGALLEVMYNVGAQLGLSYQRLNVVEELKRSERRNRLILDTAHDAFVGMNDEGIITDWNERAQVLFGWTREEAIGRPLADTIVPDRDRAAHEIGFSRFLKTGKGPVINNRVEMSAVHRSGIEFPVELTISPAMIGGRYLFSAFIHDITSRKQAQAALLESERKIKSLAKFPSERPAPVLRVDPDGNILYANAASQPILQLWNSAEMVPPGFWGAIPKTLAESHELEVSVPDGRVFSLAVVPVHDENYLNIYGTDVTQRKLAQDDLSKAKAELEVRVQQRTQELLEKSERLANSNEELEQFAFVASHDLQEPLRMVVVYLQLLEKRNHERLATQDLEFMGFAVEGALRMQSLVQDLLSFARVGKVEEILAPVDLNQVVAEAQANIRGAIEDCQASITVDPMPTIRADWMQMVQLFQNLLSNAIKYRTTTTRPLIWVSAEKQPNYWLFTVSDNGIGIDGQYAEKVFKVFQRLHSDRKKYPGTGIGLALCKKIVDRHRGRIWFESELGKGTTFHFTLRSDV